MNPDDPFIELGSPRGSFLPPGRLVVFLIVFVGAVWLFDREDPVLIVGVGLLVALVLDAVMARRGLREPRLRVEAPPEAMAGRPLAFLMTADAGHWPLLLAPLWSWPRVTIAIDGPAPGLVTLDAPPRGIVRTLVAEVGVTGPLGLYERRRLLRVWLPTPLYVAPVPLEHEVEWPPFRTIHFGTTETASIGHDLFRGVRPYVAGDPRRSVHWKATAHQGRLMVREAEGTGIVVVRLVLDVPRPGNDAEEAIARLAHVAEQALRQHWLVRLVTVENGGAVPAPPPVDELRYRWNQPAEDPFRAQITVSRDVRNQRELYHRLAAADFGSPVFEHQRVLTRRFTLTGDDWA